MFTLPKLLRIYVKVVNRSRDPSRFSHSLRVMISAGFVYTTLRTPIFLRTYAKPGGVRFYKESESDRHSAAVHWDV